VAKGASRPPEEDAPSLAGCCFVDAVFLVVAVVPSVLSSSPFGVVAVVVKAVFFV